jgi:hypothetical protein
VEISLRGPRSMDPEDLDGDRSDESIYSLDINEQGWCVCVRMYVYIYTHTHTHTHTSSRSRGRRLGWRRMSLTELGSFLHCV